MGLQAATHGMGKGIRMDFEGPPNDLVLFRPGSFSRRASEVARALCNNRLVHLVS